MMCTAVWVLVYDMYDVYFSVRCSDMHLCMLLLLLPHLCAHAPPECPCRVEQPVLMQQQLPHCVAGQAVVCEQWLHHADMQGARQGHQEGQRATWQ